MTAPCRPALCRTTEEILRAAAQHVRAQGWRLTQEQMDRFAVLLSPYLGHLTSRRTGDAA